MPISIGDVQRNSDQAGTRPKQIDMFTTDDGTYLLYTNSTRTYEHRILELS